MHMEVYNPHVHGLGNSPRLSWPALVLALVAVAASVALGLYGPRVGDRALSPLVPLREVADATDAIAQRMSRESANRPSGAELPTMQDAARVCKDALATPWQPPDLRSAGFRIVMAGPVPIPGSASAVALLYEADAAQATHSTPGTSASATAPDAALRDGDSGEGAASAPNQPVTDSPAARAQRVPPRLTIAPGPSPQPTPRRDVVIVAARDHGAFAIYDEYGRAQPLGTARSVLEESEWGMWGVMVWSDGELLFVAWAPDVALLDRLRTDLGAP
jgi:hypothetical protein